MARFIPTEQDKVNGLRAILYEIEQALESWIHTRNCDQTVKNALTESCLVKVRALVDFFEKSKRTKKDMLAEDFGFAAREITGIDKDRLHRYVAHLTYERVQSPLPNGWPLDDLVPPVLMRSADLIRHLLTPGRGNIQDAAEQAWRNLLRAIERGLESPHPHQQLNHTDTTYSGRLYDSTGTIRWPVP